MPSLHRRKIYLPKRYYHIYNQGTNKQNIFHRNRDYLFYYLCLKEYLTPKSTQIVEMEKRGYLPDNLDRKLVYLGWLKNFSSEITLVAHCLMPNHIHLLVEQNSERSITSFMQALHTRYAKYHKKHHHTFGPLFRDRFKARLIQDDKDLICVSRYIHRNPLDIGVNPETYRWSSLNYYKGIKKPSWLNTELILGKFEKSAFRTTYPSYLEWANDEPPE